MVSLFVLAVSFVVLRGLGGLSVERLPSWRAADRAPLAEALATLGPEPRVVAPTNVLRQKRPIGRCADRRSRRYRQHGLPVRWRSDGS